MIKQIIFIFFSIILFNSSIYGVLPYERLWTTLLQEHTQMTDKNRITYRGVDYQELSKSQSFRSLIRYLSSINPSENLTSKEDKLAFWINIYNIAAIRLIIDNPDVQSIKDLGNFISPVWDKQAIEIDGKFYSLGEIEHKILRPLGDPRIHFAIVCASLSCPDIRPEAYTNSKINEQLEEQIVDFINNDRKGFRIYPNTAEVHFSKIFDWFSTDFEKEGGYKRFILKYINDDIEGYTWHTLKYDWELNSL